MTLVNPYIFGGGGGGGGSATPDEIADLRCWYDAGDLVLSDGDRITSWTDGSGNSLTLDVVDGSGPTYKTGIINSLPVARFAPSEAIYTVTDVALSPTTGEWTVFAVAKRVGSTGVYSFFDDDGPNGTRGGQLLRANALTLESIAFNTANTAYTDSPGTSITAGSFHVLSAVRGSAAVESFIDGVGNGSTATSGTPAVGSANRLFMGRTGRTASQYLDGDIAEIVGYSRALSSVERGQIEDYLASKYGL